MGKKLSCIIACGLLLLIVCSNNALSIDFRGKKPQKPDRVCWVVIDGTEFYESPDGRNVIGKGSFLDTFHICKEENGKKGNCFLLGKVDSNQKITEFVGWVKSDDVLTESDREAMKTGNNIYRKALIINRWREADGKTILEGAKVYKGYGEKYGEIRELGLFKFYYIYKRGGIAGSGDYRLLGSSSLIIERPEDVIIGWVDNKRIFEWDTRQAVQFKKSNLKERKNPVRIFSTSGELELFLKNIRTHPDTGESIEPVASENMKVGEWEYSTMRYPLLGSQQSDTGTRLFHVGYIGDEIEIGGKGRRSAHKVANDQQKMQDLQKKLKNIEILFVIDATGSMASYFSSVGYAVEGIVDILKEEYGSKDPERPNLHFAVLFYRDYSSEEKLWEYRPPTSEHNFRDFVNYVKEMKVYRTGPWTGGDEPEAVFFGICNALEETKFQANSLRAIILIGDKGNHRNDERGYTVEKVIKKLKEKKATFIAFHVVSETYVDQDWTTADFKKQTKKIIEGLDEGEGQYIIEPNPSKVADEITASLKGVLMNSKNMRGGIEILSEGESIQAVKDKYGVFIARKVIKELQDIGINPELFAKKRVQIFDTGWLAETDPETGNQQAETMVLMDRLALTRLNGILAGFIQKVDPKKIGQTWKKSLEEQIGETYDKSIKVSEYFHKHLGLAVREGLLKKSLEEIVLLRPDQILSLQKRLRKKFNGLNDILSERECEIKMVDDKKPDGTIDTKEVRLCSGKGKKYFWLTKDREFAWINIESMP